jgi:hypothetical protein
VGRERRPEWKPGELIHTNSTHLSGDTL